MTSAASMWLPLGFDHWRPSAQALTLGLLTFVQEDVPTMSAALLAAAGGLPWPVGCFAVFLGIWVGDALLYWLARGCGRPCLRYGWVQRFFDPAAVARSERWFSERGTWIGVNDTGATLALLNCYAIAARVADRAVSRGVARLRGLDRSHAPETGPYSHCMHRPTR